MTRSPLSVRRARTSDADALTAFNLALAAESEGRRLSPEVVARGVRRVLADPSRGVYYVAERAGRVVGQLLVTFEFSDWRDAVFWWIQSVYVLPDCRRQGILRALYDHVVAEARQSGATCGLRLYVDRRNAAAQRAYVRLGLRVTEYVLYEDDWSGNVLS